ncbi:unnamed protein product [Adineta steineri]|uniref:N-acetyltransferase domain-containing protein n=1 Tax=Adineta steineri TaxID=433720 RepID=A0A815MF89_9BILA|nr:unnamed protein product [Adineta steineri]CAF4006078.1 unnamed protein product [Adineta steineri]
MSNEIHESDEQPILNRWDSAWDEYQKKEYEQDSITNKNINIREKTAMSSVHSVIPTSTNTIDVYVREFIPTTPRDPTFSILRHLFVRSFDEFYNKIENQLNLKSQKNLLQWLDETFDEEQECILSRKYRCFILYTYDKNDLKETISGFLTLKEEEEQGSIYIAQVAVHLGMKRRGYGAQLLKHLRDIYPANTKYWGLCRRANRPALQFYLKLGAQFMENDDIATKYGYNPELYTGFEFVDTVPVIVSTVPSVPKRSARIEKSEQLQQAAATIVTTDQQNPSSSTNDEQISQQQQQQLKLPKKPVQCCTVAWKIN